MLCLSRSSVHEGTYINNNYFSLSACSLAGLNCNKQQAVEKPVACHCEEQDPSPVIARDKVPKQSHRFGAGSAISNPLILLKARLPRFARNDRKKTFSTALSSLTLNTSSKLYVNSQQAVETIRRMSLRGARPLTCHCEGQQSRSNLIGSGQAPQSLNPLILLKDGEDCRASLAMNTQQDC